MHRQRSHDNTTPEGRRERLPLVRRTHVPWECRLRPPVVPTLKQAHHSPRTLSSDLCVWCCTSPSELVSRISVVLFSETKNSVRPHVVPCALEYRSLFDSQHAPRGGGGTNSGEEECGGLLRLCLVAHAQDAPTSSPRILVVADDGLLRCGVPWSVSSFRVWLRQELPVAAIGRGDTLVLECNDPSSAMDLAAVLRDHFSAHGSPLHPHGRWALLLHPQLCIRRCVPQQQRAAVFVVGSRTWAAACAGGQVPLWEMQPMLSDAWQWALAWSAWLLQDPLAQRVHKTLVSCVAKSSLDALLLVRSSSTPAAVDVAMLQCATVGGQAADIRRAWCVSGWDFVVRLPSYVEVLSAGNGAQTPGSPEECSFCRMVLCVRDARRVARALSECDVVCTCPTAENFQRNTMVELPVSPWMSRASRRRVLDAIWRLPQDTVESPYLPRGSTLERPTGNRYATKQVLNFLRSAESKAVLARFGEPFPLLVGLVFGPLGVVASKL